MKIKNEHNNTALVITITYDGGDNGDEKVLTLSGAGAATIVLTDKTLEEVRDKIKSIAKLDAEVDPSRALKSAMSLDASNIPDIAAGASGELKANRQEMIDVLKDRSSYVEYKETKGAESTEATIFDGTTKLEFKTTLTTANKASLQAGFDEALNQDFALVTLAFSENTGSDITLQNSHDLLKAHLALRGDEKHGKEAQAIIGVRTDSLEQDFELISQIADPSIQAVCQEVTKLDTSDGRAIKGPHILAAMLCAVRLGTPIGTPLTRKAIGALLVQHRLKDNDGAIVSADAFNTSLKGEEAIASGVTYIEQRRGQYVCALDNTTYVADDSFVWNRGSVVEATYYTSRVLREDLEAFVGGKISSSTKDAVQTRMQTRLEELGSPEVAILSPSDDAPSGYKTESLRVSIKGNTLEASVEFKPVQGLDFVFLTLTISDIVIS